MTTDFIQLIHLTQLCNSQFSSVFACITNWRSRIISPIYCLILPSRLYLTNVIKLTSDKILSSTILLWKDFLQVFYRMINFKFYTTNKFIIHVAINTRIEIAYVWAINEPSLTLESKMLKRTVREGR